MDNKTFVYQYDPETKQQSSVWLFPGESPPVKFKRSRSTSKQMIVVIFAKFSHVDLPTPGEEDSIRWYINICLRKVCEAWSAYLPNDGACSLLLHHNNASAHTSAITLDYMETNRIQLVTQTLFSLGLAPCDSFLFPQAKQQSQGK